MPSNRRTYLRRLAGSVAALTAQAAVRKLPALDDEPAASSERDMEASPDQNAPERRGMMTLGGRQFWGDVCFRGGYRIQRNIFTGHHRLLDSGDRRFESGLLESCRETLRQICQEQQIPDQTGRVVILLHGLGRSSHAMDPIKHFLEKRGLTCCPFSYPSTRIALADCANYLRDVLMSMPNVTQISFVAHSMGGLVVRRLLQDYSDERMEHLVMLGTPNQGADLATMLKNLSLFKLIYGPAGGELARGEGSTVSNLPVPQFPFAVIAGGKGDNAGYNQLLEGDDDGTVTVASTQLAGASDFLVVPRLHSFLMSSPEVLAAIYSFLQTNRFDLESDNG